MSKGSTVNQKVVMFVAGLVLCQAVIASAESRHLVTIDDLARLVDVNEVAMSPDGGWVVYGSKDALWLMASTPGSHARKIGQGSQPLWSPNSKAFAYYSGASGATQLWAFSLSTERSRLITHAKNGLNASSWTGYIGMRGGPRYALTYSWSPDGARLVFPSQSRIERQDQAADRRRNDIPLILNNETPPSWTMSGIFRSGGFGEPRVVKGKISWKRETPLEPPPVTANELFTVSIRNGEIKKLTQTGQTYFGPDWSPDGRKIVCLSNEGRPLVGWGSGPTNLFLIDAATGQATALTSDATYKRAPRWSPDGTWIAYLSQDEGFHQSLSIVPAKGGSPIALTASMERDVSDFAWYPDSKSFLISYDDGPRDSIARLEIATRETNQLSSGSAYRGNISISRTGVVTWDQNDATGQGKIYVLPYGASSPYLLTNLNSQVDDWNLGRQQVVKWQNSQGEDLEGILITPPGYKKGERYPLIVDCYPSLTNGFKGWPMIGNQAWAAQGYVVFWPASRAPNQWQNPYKSPSFGAEAKGGKGIDIMVDDIMSGIDMLVHDGIIDQEKIGVYGFSLGGGILNQLIRKSSRFKCAITVEAGGLTDVAIGFFLYTYNKIAAANAGALPWEDPQTYVDLSVIYHLDQIRTPLLIVEGDDDGMFLLNSIELYNGLRWLHRDVTLLRYPDQGHGFTGTTLQDFSRRVIAFFDEHLKGDQMIHSQSLGPSGGYEYR
jgi:dipeptidyl aminopeptidase/acylaminoacyl peptidase